MILTSIVIGEDENGKDLCLTKDEPYVVEATSKLLDLVEEEKRKRWDEACAKTFKKIKYDDKIRVQRDVVDGIIDGLYRLRKELASTKK